MASKWLMNIRSTGAPITRRVTFIVYDRHIDEHGEIDSAHIKSGTTALEIKNVNKLTSMTRELPPSVTDIHLSHCDELTVVHASPNIRAMYLLGLPSLKSVEFDKNESITYVNVADCNNLATVNIPDAPDAPATLLGSYSLMNFTRCDSLTSVVVDRELSLQTIRFDRCPELDSVVIAKGSIHELDFTLCPKLVGVSGIAKDTVRRLEITNCIHAFEIIQSMKDSTRLNRIQLYRCSLTELPDVMPDSVQYLRFDMCAHLVELPYAFPRGLRELFIIQCPKLTRAEIIKFLAWSDRTLPASMYFDRFDVKEIIADVKTANKNIAMSKAMTMLNRDRNFDPGDLARMGSDFL